jgi:competence protein ComEC
LEITVLKNRLLAGCILAFSIGIGTGLYSDGKIRVAAFALFGVLCGLSLAAHCFFALKTKRLFVLSLLILAGLAYSCIFNAVVFSGYEAYNGKTDTVTASVDDVGSYTDGGYFDITIRESQAGLENGTGVRLYYAGKVMDTDTGSEVSVRRGDSLTCNIKYKVHSNNSLFAKSISLTAQGMVESVTTGDGFFYQLRKNTEDLTGKLFKDYPEEVGGIAKTLIVGETADMDSYVYGLFRNAGLSHLLVISGLHITIIVMSLYSLLEFLTVRRQVRSIACNFVLITYSAFVGFSPSVSRAAIMTGVMLLLSLVVRRTDSITSLFLALLLLLLINPYNLASISLGLSFLSCLGILILSPYLMRPIKSGNVRLKKLAMSVLSPLIYALTAAVFTFPVSLVFDSVSYITAITNLFYTPLYTYLLIILIPCLILFALIGSGGAVLSFIPGVFMQYSTELLKKLYQAGIGSFSTHIPLMFLPLVFSLAVILSLCILRHKRMFITTGILTFCFIASTAFCILNFKSQCKDISVTAVTDGWLYKSLFVADDDGTLYIELGGKRSGIKTVFLHGYSHLDRYVMNDITESDYTKLEDALTQINVKTIYIPDVDSGVAIDSVIHKIKVLANDRGCDIITYNTAIYLNTGYSSVEIVNGGKGTLSDSLVVKVKRDGRTVSVYGGDRTGNPYDYAASDTAVILEGFEKPDEIISTQRCIKEKDQNGTSTGNIHDYSETDYVRVSIKDRAVEVSMDEP